ncbi:MAG: hypothetical protein QF872_01050, partial [Gammaproteobacteria bacterium]|nr:hypothetical protein [Gammaproteobacteria bacterium]
MERSESSSFESEIDSDSTSFESTSSVKKSASAAVVTSTATMDDLIATLTSELKAEFSDLTSAQKNVLLTIYQSEPDLFGAFISEIMPDDGVITSTTQTDIAKILDSGQMATFLSILDGPDFTAEQQAVLDFIEAANETLFNTFMSTIESGEPSDETIAAIDAILDDEQMAILASMGDDTGGTGGGTGTTATMADLVGTLT